MLKYQKVMAGWMGSMDRIYGHSSNVLNNMSSLPMGSDSTKNIAGQINGWMQYELNNIIGKSMDGIYG